MDTAGTIRNVTCGAEEAKLLEFAEQLDIEAQDDHDDD